MALEEERQHFAQLKDSLLENHEGKYALIHGAKLIDVLDSQEGAYLVGVKLLGAQPFLIQHIVEQESVEEIPAFSVGVMNAHLP